MTLEEALTDVKIAFLQVEFAVKLHSYCEFDKVNLPEFDKDEIILLEHGNLHFPNGNFRQSRGDCPSSERYSRVSLGRFRAGAQ